MPKGTVVKKYEKLAFGLIGLLLLSHIFPIARDVYLAHVYGAIGAPPMVKKEWASASVLFAHLVNVGVAIWLFMDASRERVSRWIWGIFGLVFGLLGLVVFYVLVSYQKTGYDRKPET